MTLVAPIHRPNCERPDACVARGAGHCRACRAREMQKRTADPEVRARMSAASKKAWADPEVRARMTAASKKALADPEVRARMTAALADPEVRARMTAASKKAWARRALLEAGLVPWKATVARAAALFAAGEPLEVVIDALRQEARAA